MPFARWRLTVCLSVAILLGCSDATGFQDPQLPVEPSTVPPQVGTVSLDGATGAPPEYEAVCHWSEEDGTFRMITVPAQSVPHHIAHGDGLVGHEVPGSPGLVFDETCAPVPAATETTYAIAGVFDHSNEPLLPVGTQYTGALTFDASSLLTAAAPFGGVRYQPAFFSFRAGAVEFSGPTTIDIDSSHDWIRIDGYPMLGTLSASIRINLSGSGLTSDDFPDPFPTLTDFAGVTQLVVNTACCTNTASITTFGPIP